MQKIRKKRRRNQVLFTLFLLIVLLVIHLQVQFFPQMDLSRKGLPVPYPLNVLLIAAFILAYVFIIYPRNFNNRVITSIANEHRLKKLDLMQLAGLGKEDIKYREDSKTFLVSYPKQEKLLQGLDEKGYLEPV